MQDTWKQGMVQWWEHFPPNNVAQVHQLVSIMPYVGLRGFSPGPLVFPFPHKPTFPNSSFTRNGRRAMWTCHLSLVKFIYFMYLKLGADFSNCDGKKTKQKQPLVHLPLGCDLWAILVAVGCVWIPSAINP